MHARHVTFLIVVLSLAGLGAAYACHKAQGPLSRPELPGAPAPRAATVAAAGGRLPLKHTRGTISAVDTRGGVLTLRLTEGSAQMKVDPSTTVFLNGRNSSAAELRVGQAVCATYEVDDAARIAQWIEPCALSGP